jgi:glucose-6-phosphate dehydrogenase assembly protein OpcA
MSTTPDLVDRFRRGEDLAVNLGAIEKELTALWKAASQDSSSTATRACLWNLVVHSHGYEESDRLRMQLEEIYPTIPMRTLLLEVDKEADPPLSAWVSARCHIVGKGKQVCSEEVTIRCNDDVLDRLPPIFHALLVPDLPAAAWWPDLKQDIEPLAPHLLSVVDRLVVDSSTAPGAVGLHLLQRLVARRKTSRTHLGDLAWHRVAPWRSLLARLFDAPEARADLAHIDRVEVTTTGRSGQPLGSPGLLLTGWLAAQLGWKPQHHAWTRPDGAQVALHVHQQRGGRQHDLQSVTLKTSQGHSYTLDATGDERMRAFVPHLGEGERAFLRLQHRTDAQFLQRELGPLGNDPALWASLDHALL